jgi:hypothetical protein
MPADYIWVAREQSWSYLNTTHPSRVASVIQTFSLIDECLDQYEIVAGSSVYARICGLTLLKGKNLAQGCLSLVLDALGQESGALLRPFVEYIELLTFFREFPEQAERAAESELPSAGKRAQAISGIYKELRKQLNEHASHGAYSHFSLSHLLKSDLSFRRLQEFAPEVLDRNFRDFSVQLQFLLQEGLLALKHVPDAPIVELARKAEGARKRMLFVFGLNGS